MSEKMLSAYYSLITFPNAYTQPSAEEFIQAHNSTAPTCIRKHPIKSADATMDLLSSSTPIKHLKDAYLLDNRPQFIKDPLWHAGNYYVQEANSMYVGQIIQEIKLNSDAPLRVLDLCAAPGGKSTNIASMLSNSDLLISNEIHPQRSDILNENLCKWGFDYVWVTNNAPKDFAEVRDYFDIIVIDAPCSGSGMWRKDPDTINEWSQQNVKICEERQIDILDHIIPSLKDGGILIYSTCSYSQEENEDIIDYLADNYDITTYNWKADGIEQRHQSLSPRHNIPCFRKAPWDSEGEGFFFSVVKINQDKAATKNKIKNNIKRVERHETDYLTDKIIFEKEKEHIHFIDASHESDYTFFTQKKRLKFKKMGTRIGEILKNQLVPDHEWALSINAPRQHFPMVDVDLETALNYLRRENIHIETENKGWVIISYQQQPLGWVKCLGNRTNNYYPKHWRIRYV